MGGGMEQRRGGVGKLGGKGRKKWHGGRGERRVRALVSFTTYCTHSLPLVLAQSPNSVLKSPQYCISVMQSLEGKQQLQPYAAIPSTVESKSPLHPTQGEGEGGEADSDQGTYALHTHSLFIGQYTV